MLQLEIREKHVILSSQWEITHQSTKTQSILLIGDNGCCFLDQYCHPEVELRQNMFKISCRGQLELLTSVGVCLVPDPGGPAPSCFSGGKNEEDYRLINTRLINDHVTPL